MITHASLRNKLTRLPPIELSYETYSHKKDSSESYTQHVMTHYDVGLCIPKSKKYLAWFTFIGEEDVCILLELNREKQIVSHQLVQVDFDTKEPHLALGTIFYGSLLSDPGSATSPRRAVFVIEDVLVYKSVSLRRLCFGDSLGVLYELLHRPHLLSSRFSEQRILVEGATPHDPPAPPGLLLTFALPVMFSVKDLSAVSPDNVGYVVHHVQYRSFTKTVPYLNDLKPLSRSPTGQHVPAIPYAPAKLTVPHVPCVPTKPTPHPTVPTVPHVPPRPGKPPPPPSSSSGTAGPPTRERAVFWVTADMQSDIYYLAHPQSLYAPEVAYIPNYKTSVYMNSLFRHVKENHNLDAMEESDDEADFADTRPDKYVDLNKQLAMECVYYRKFKRWIPLRVATQIPKL